ncbi:MAG: branched-chain amino acid transaminase [Bacteroidota bacterium]
MRYQNLIVFHNGKYDKAQKAREHLFNQTMHYGVGVFEGIRAYRTIEGGVRIFKAQEHFERLSRSAQAIHIDIPYPNKELEDIAYKLLEKNQLTDAYIRPLVYLGEEMSLHPSRQVNVFMGVWQWGKYLGDKPLKVMISSYERPNPKAFPQNAKINGAYVNSSLATHEAHQKGFDEALLCDMKGNIAEGAGQNFFCEKDQILYTPPLGNILPGITRATIIQLAKKLGMKVEEKYFGPDALQEIDGAFFTGTATEVACIQSIDGQKVKLPWEETMGYALQQEYLEYVRAESYQTYTII